MRYRFPWRRRSTSAASHKSRQFRTFGGGARRLRMESLEDRRVLATFTVTNTSDAGPGSLRDAIAQANANNNSPAVVDVIDFGPLFSTPQTILLLNDELSITESLVIEGPGAELLSIDASGNDATPLVKDGQGSRVFNIDDGDSETNIEITLSGMTITGGDLGGLDVTTSGGLTTATLETSGGGILSYEDLSIIDSIITDNAIIADFGGDEYDLGVVRINGGGVASLSGKLMLSGSIITNNHLLADFSNATLQTEAVAMMFGGGAYAASELEVSVSLVQNNTVVVDFTNLIEDAGISPRGTEPQLYGGGIAYDGLSIASITKSLIDNNIISLVANGFLALGNDNTPTLRGGGLYAFGGTALTDTTISNNKAIFDLSFFSGSYWLNIESFGGGAYFFGGADIISSTISGNSLNTIISGSITMFSGRSEGAGLYASGNIRHSTIADNEILDNSGPVGIEPAGAGFYGVDSTILHHTLIADNSGADDLDLRALTTLDASYNLIENTTVSLNGTNISGQDPNLSPLQDNGGFKLPDGSRILTHALLPGSLAIDAGDATLVAGVGDTPAYDQRGYPFNRVIDAPGTPQSGARIDIGAFEYGYSADANGNGYVDGGDFLAWQRGYGMTSGATRADGDFDGDGDVDSDDLEIWKAMFGAIAPPVDE